MGFERWWWARRWRGWVWGLAWRYCWGMMGGSSALVGCRYVAYLVHTFRRVPWDHRALVATHFVRSSWPEISVWHGAKLSVRDIYIFLDCATRSQV